MTQVLFHAPLKPPGHPEPSGDREMARLLVRALEGEGYTVEIASQLRMLDRAGDAALMRSLHRQAAAEARAIVDAVRRRPGAARPRLFFTYHVHYKAPDVIGPAVSRALGIPYVVAEGSRAPKRAGGAWTEGHRLAEAALDAADLVFVMNPRDREALERLAPPNQRLVELPPFVDAGAWPALDGVRRPPGPGPARLLAVAMMRQGDKLSSYRLLADALARIPAGAWTLDVVGEGPAGAQARGLFAGFGEAVRCHGLVQDREALAALYAGADLLVWPAVNEAYGMVFLEAALQGCPALAGRYGGVPGVIRDGETGLLVAAGDADAFATGLRDLVSDRARLATLGEAAARFVRAERTLAGAGSRLCAALAPLVARVRPAQRETGA